MCTCNNEEVMLKEKRRNALELLSGVANVSHGSQEVRLIVNDREKQPVEKYKCVSPRLLWVKNIVEIRRLFIIECYAAIKIRSGDIKGIS